MALLNFPSNPTNNQIYPTTVLVGQNQYKWDATNQVWALLGSATGVSAGTYGDATNVGQFTVDATGRISSAQNVPISSGAGGTVTSVTAGTGITGGTITSTGTVALDTAYTDTLYVKFVTAPATSASPGALGQVAVGLGNFYFYDGAQWLQVAGVTFP
jgi:hypothetical protein